MIHKADHAYIGAGLIMAGFLPGTLFSNSTLQAVYFALLIPPAAWHCWTWFRKTFLDKK